jgi:protoporphyrin/coproporphyrin ferrochelatase
MRIGIVLATYGEPPESGFAAQWMYSYRILKRLTRKIAAIPAPVLPIIATSRAITRVKMWRRHNFSSPLEPLHQQTVEALEHTLQRRLAGSAGMGAEIFVVPGYEFRRPDIGDAVEDLRESGCSHIIVVPMYIAEGDFTHGMTRIGVDDALARTRWPGHRLSMCSLAERHDTEQRLADTITRHLLGSIRRRGIEGPLENWAVLLAAHGTVVSPLPGVDNGLEQFGRVLHRVKVALRPHTGLVRVGWLNHTRGGRWTTPAVPQALEYIRERGYDNLIYFPWGFTTDNAETALEGKIALEELADPFARIEHIGCLNAEEHFIQLLADRLCSHIGQLTTPHLASTPARPLQPALSA